MARLKRVALLFAEVALFSLGTVGSLVLAGLLDSSENQFAGIGFISGLLLTVVGWLALRRKTRRWKIEQDAVRWMASRSFEKKYPHRAKWLRIVWRWLLWVPSACAALAVFFLPVTSHILLFGRHLMPHYRLSVPLSWMVIRGFGGYPFASTFFTGEGANKYGMTAMWFSNSMPSAATFMVSDPAVASHWYLPEHELATGRATHLAKRDFKMGTTTMSCWEYRQDYQYSAEIARSLLHPPVLWEVLCSTEPNGVDFNLRASFLGRKEDIRAFYKVLEAGKPIR